jgi:hypothetical protein
MGTAGNASPFYSQTPALQTASAAAPQPVTVNPGWSPSQRALAATYNRLGGLLSQVANIVSVPVSPALAVWHVESGGVAFTPNQATIRFEVGRLLSAWGNANPANFDAHFQCGGRNGIPPPSWKNHAFSAAGGGPFVPVHQNQASEYAALKLASDVAGQEVSVRCISIGGCQIMISNFPMLGYSSGLDMYNAFQFSENAHVLGFFDFCARRGGGLFGFLQKQPPDFSSFATQYNGSGQVQVYAGRLKSATDDVNVVLGGS